MSNIVTQKELIEKYTLLSNELTLKEGKDFRIIMTPTIVEISPDDTIKTRCMSGVLVNNKKLGDDF